MSKTNIFKAKTFRISTNKIIYQYLEDLVKIGEYGNGVQDAGERVIVDRIRELIKQEVLQKRPSEE